MIEVQGFFLSVVALAASIQYGLSSGIIVEGYEVGRSGARTVDNELN